ncbi:MAG: class I SAM-dependent methyltransferase [Planctomycetes bacterium]|jgi:ubiquinone/menaquinone biosynthesis C-methylase UbiE|nr:class I SAM-dependent methyltransferase [Planctomycetota bacterium]
MAEHVCPVWAGHFLANRLRKLLQNPCRILAPYVRPGQTILDVGSAMGDFSLPMAEMVGPEGKVVCVDVQSGMLKVLRRRATGAGLAERIETHLSTADSIGLRGRDGTFDFALAFTMLHEVGNQANFLREIHQLLKPGAHLLLTEPIQHVSRPEFDRTVSTAQQAGFSVTNHPPIRLSQSVLLTKPAERHP